MLGDGLSKEEIAKRLVRLRNVEVLHEAQRFKVWHLRDENRSLRKEVTLLKATVKEQQHTIDDLKLQMEELRIIVFGKKKRKYEGSDDDLPPIAPKPPIARSKDSYRRKLPREDEVTETREYPVALCAHCGGGFGERDRIICFEEDIPLPQKKIVVKHLIEKGWCEPCRTWSAGAPLPAAPVILGPTVKRYVAYLGVICRQSYSQIEDILKQGYDFDISQGEIAKIVEKEGERLRPEYERLLAQIRDEPSIHLDETRWDIFTNKGERGFAWTMVGGVSQNTVFALGKSRGRGNAEDLIGGSKAIRVTDDYAAYRNLKGKHQLCLAHILRKLRDLARSVELMETKRAHCISAYKTFAAVYADIENARTSPDAVSAYDALHERLARFAAPSPRDPAKLARVKTQVRKRVHNYLTCLTHQDVASDNNVAERSLRHLVLKRKISFGSLCERTAETMAILCSVLLSYKHCGTLRNYLAGV